MSNAVLENHETVALSRFSLQYREKPNLAAFTRILSKHTQAIETMLWGLVTERRVSSAVGKQLDILGAIVGQARGALSDSDYREYIKVRLKTNDSSGTLPELIDIVGVLADPTADIQGQEFFPAAMTVTIAGVVVDPSIASIILGFVRLAKAGGVNVQLVWANQSPSTTFAFDGATGDGFGAGYFCRAAE